jgi:hypothetical protein
MTRKKLPIGIETFREIREDDTQPAVRVAAGQ